jgi:hypothetical protein
VAWWQKFRTSSALSTNVLVLFLLGIEILAGFYWLKSSFDEGIRRIETRLDTVENKLTVIEQKMTEPEKRI